MELINGNCGSLSNDTDDEEEASPVESPPPSRRIVPSPPLPPRRSSPSPTSNPNHLRNGRHLTVPKENAPPPPPPPPANTAVTLQVLTTATDTATTTTSTTSTTSNTSTSTSNNKANTESRYDMLHRASSPCPVPPVVIRPRHTPRTTSLQQVAPPPALPEKSSSSSSSSTSSSSSSTPSSTSSTSSSRSSSGAAQQQIPPPVPPPLSVPRPPKESSAATKQDHLYENTIMIPGTKQHVVKNINLEVSKARISALMKGKDESGRPIPKSSDTAAYENINVEYISRLVALGFAQDAVIRALGITRNDLEMACDILHEFTQKSS